MLNKEIIEIVNNFKKTGWMPEPEAKRLFAMAGLDIPGFAWAHTPEKAFRFADQTGFPLVAKVVSPRIIHKSDVGGVITGIDSKDKLEMAYHAFSKLDGFDGMLVEETVTGQELIVGAKIDYQFGPVILLGIGGTGVEIYQDVTMRMTPIDKGDVISMIDSLKGGKILRGFRGGEPVNLDALTLLLSGFSSLVTDLEEHIQSIDLNPVMCSGKRCVIADARIILNGTNLA
ncbi:MAG: acetate--CoA ligase family protein [Deltaproteobacteria bacterium]|nr:acetate--CoA ligase family protein [Deltaproteobacteria bacterium]